jgi:hypothetical protein
MSFFSIREMMDTYRRVGAAQVFKPIAVYDHTPTVTPRDVAQGEFTRYFARPSQQTSHVDIQEIDRSTYIKLQRNALYTVVEVRWQISGPLHDEYTLTESSPPVRLRSGVMDSNRRSIELANERLPGLTQVVTQYARFYQGL